MTYKLNLRKSEFISVILLTALLLTYLLPVRLEAQEAKSVALVFKVSGTLDIKRRNSNSWVRGKRGDLLDSGDQLKTGARSLTTILFQDDKSVLKVGSNSEMTINAQRQEKSLFKKLYLGLGSLWMKITEKEDQQFSVETPTSVASIKGSEGLESVAATGDTKLFGITGEFEFSTALGKVTIGANETGIATRGNPPVKRRTDPRDLQATRAATGLTEEETKGLQSETAPPEEIEGEQEVRIPFVDEDGNVKVMIIRIKGQQ